MYLSRRSTAVYLHLAILFKDLFSGNSGDILEESAATRYSPSKVIMIDVILYEYTNAFEHSSSSTSADRTAVPCLVRSRACPNTNGLRPTAFGLRPTTYIYTR